MICGEAVCFGSGLSERAGDVGRSDGGDEGGTADESLELEVCSRFLLGGDEKQKSAAEVG